MSQSISWTDEFGGAEFGLVQEKPYPVASPSTVDALAAIVQYCAEQGWRVLPMGLGSSFPSNFSLRTERTFAITTSRLREVSRLTNGRIYCQPGVAVQKVLLCEQTLQRSTIGGLICGSGDAATRNAGRLFWQLIHCVEMIDSKGRTVVLPGPSSPQSLLGASSTRLLESRGRAGILVGIEFCADELPLELGGKLLCSTSSDNLSSPIGRHASLRGADAMSLFDW